MKKLQETFDSLMARINENTSIADDKVSSKFDKELNVWLAKGKETDHLYHSDKDPSISKEFSTDLSKVEKAEEQKPMPVGGIENPVKDFDRDKIIKWVESTPKEFEELIIKRDLEELTRKAMEKFKIDDNFFDCTRQAVKEALKI